MRRTLLALVFACLALPAAAATDFVAYHDRFALYHRNQVKTLGDDGYRMVSLTTYGGPAAPRFAAVWVRRQGSPWRAFDGLTLPQLQARAETERKEGYQLTMITSVGVADQARFSGTFGLGTVYSVRYPLTGADFEKENITQKKAGRMLRSAIDFGSASTPLYIGIWEPNPRAVGWNVGWNLTAAEDQHWFDAQTAQWARPVFASRNAHGRYLSVYRDDQIGDWVARGELTADAYQAEVDKLKPQGFYPMCVQASGVGASTRFAAIFVKSESTLGRQWSVTGPAVPALAQFDNIVKARMQKNGVRAGAVAIARDGKLVFARGYTNAEAGYPKTEPVSLFRIASCSKPVTSIAIHQLIEQGKLSLDDRVQTILQTSPAAGKLDARYDDIRIWHLLSHLGGRLHGPDLPDHFAVRETVKRPFALAKGDVASYMAGQPLDFDPGAKPWKWDYYSNLGYLLLGHVIEKKVGGTYHQAVHDAVWKPLGVTRPRIARSRVHHAWPGEVRYHDRDPKGFDLRVAPSVVDDTPLVPLPYGGENYATFDAFGGWVLAAPDYAKLLAAFDLADNPLFAKETTVTTMWSTPDGYQTTNPDLLRGWFAQPRPGGVTEYKHGGGLPGVSTVIVHRSDGLSIVAFFNGPIGAIDAELNTAAEAIAPDAWPTHDLFPQMKIPSFPKLTLAPRNKLARTFPATVRPRSLPFPEIVTPAALRR